MPGFLSDRNKKRKTAKKHHSPTKWSFSPAAQKPEPKPEPKPELPEVYSDPCDSKPEPVLRDPVYQSVCKSGNRRKLSRKPLAEKSNFQGSRVAKKWKISVANTVDAAYLTPVITTIYFLS